MAAQGTQANITRVKVDLPKQLPSRLTTLQKACTNAKFRNESCELPDGIDVGYAKAITTRCCRSRWKARRIFVSPWWGSVPEPDDRTAGLRRHGRSGRYDVHQQSRDHEHDVQDRPRCPLQRVPLTLPEGKYSALAANLPGKARAASAGKLAMPTEFLAQNGTVIKGLSTPISVTGCAKTKALTRAQKLAKR